MVGRLTAQTRWRDALHMVRTNPQEKVLLLDLDKCSVMGDDTNDTLRLALTAVAEGRPDDGSLLRLARQLVNPTVYSLVPQYERKYGCMPFVMLYTAKGSLLNLLVKASGGRAPLVKANILNQQGNRMFFEPCDQDAGYQYLTHQLSVFVENPTVFKAMALKLAPVGLVGAAIADVMGLPYLPGVVVTSTYKDVRLLAEEVLHVDPEQCLLIDDSAVRHVNDYNIWHRDEKRTVGESRMLPVAEYHTQHLSDQALHGVNASLDRLCPLPMIKDKIPVLHGQITKATHDWPEHKLLARPDGVTYAVGESARRDGLDQAYAEWAVPIEEGRGDGRTWTTAFLR